MRPLRVTEGLGVSHPTDSDQSPDWSQVTARGLISGCDAQKPPLLGYAAAPD